jgi:hypothetical protein
MTNQLEQLKSETQRAETDFQNEVKYYLLNPLETPEEFHQALAGLFESVTKYHIALGKLRKYLASMRDFEQLITRKATIDGAIASLNVRDAALERLLKRVSRLAADRSPHTRRTLAAPKL